jgi:CheY-like chemotaxis protein
MRALVVEDEAALREALHRDLTAAGFTVDLAADGEEGLFAGSEYPIDVAVIDLGLPKISGLDLIRQLRARDRRFPILILTARSLAGQGGGLDAGADDYVAKPFISPRCWRGCRRCCVAVAAGPPRHCPADRSCSTPAARRSRSRRPVNRPRSSTGSSST